MLKMSQTRSHRKTVEKITGLNTEQKGLKCTIQRNRRNQQIPKSRIRYFRKKRWSAVPNSAARFIKWKQRNAHWPWQFAVHRCFDKKDFSDVMGSDEQSEWRRKETWSRGNWCEQEEN